MNLVNKVTPQYPPLAKAARIQGTVTFNATIATDGSIKNLELISGHPLLAAAAQESGKAVDLQTDSVERTAGGGGNSNRRELHAVAVGPSFFSNSAQRS